MNFLTSILRYTPKNWPPALRWLAMVALFAGLAFASLTPGAAPSEKYGIDLSLHAFAYAISMAVAVILTGRPIASAIALIVYSALLEYAQSFVPGRNGALDDFLLNCVGIGFVLVAFLLLKLPGRNGSR